MKNLTYNQIHPHPGLSDIRRSDFGAPYIDTFEQQQVTTVKEK